MKKIIAMMLTISALLGSISGIGVSASDTPAGTPISTVEEFLAMSQSGVYYLTNDLDFSGKSYTSQVYNKTFTGVLDGNGFALLGITVKGTNSDAGVFGNMFSGTIKNLTLGTADHPISVSSTGSQYSVAAIAATMTNGATIENVTVYGNIKGDGKTSGITSYVHTGKVSVSGTKIYGSIKGNPASGFFALSNDGSSDITITNSFNFATVVGGSSSAGGFYTVVGSTGGGRSGNLTITGSANFGAIEATDWRCGGIVGEFNEKSDSKLTVDFCYNMGNITMTGAGGFAAGIVGGACYNAPNGARRISNVYNGGIVKNTANANNEYQLVYAAKSNSTVSLTNASYLLEGKTSENVQLTNVTKAATVEELTATVKGYTASADGNFFVGATAGVNNGYPILAHEATSHENVKVYDCQRRVCLDCGKIISDPDEENHIYIKETVAPSGYVDGYVKAVCSACGATAIEASTPSAYKPSEKNGVYEIATADHLRWYQANLAAGLLSGREALILTADIDLENKEFSPIGSTEHPFGGKFDGAMHKITNLLVKTEWDGGLFGVLSLGAAVSMLELDGVTVEADGNAGALFGAVAPRGIVTLDFILLNNLNVTSASASAGALGGSSEEGMSLKATAIVADKVTVKGQYAGGLVGYASSTELNNCHVNATVSGKTASSTGTLAYFGDNYSAKNSFYVKNGVASKQSGEEIEKNSFVTGEVAYRVNTYAAKSVVGVENGKITFGSPVYGVRNGKSFAYTGNLLSDTGDLEVYTDGKLVAIAVKRESGPRLTDLSIKLMADGKTIEVKPSELCMTRRAELGGKVYTVDANTALYTIALENATAYEIGTLSDSVITK